MRARGVTRAPGGAQAQAAIPVRAGIRAWAAALVTAGTLAGAAGAAAQHVAPPAAEGVRVPQVYFQRVAADPTAFTLPNGLFRVTATGPMAGEQFGKKGMLVLPALFADSPEPHVSPAQMQQLIFDGPAPRGTLSQAYAEMSRGAFAVDGRVLPWVRTTLTRAEVVGTNSGLGSDAQVGPYLVEALQRADADVDFGAYDNDGPDGIPNSGDDDGYVDAMAFEHIEVAGSCGGPGIWPHRWGIAAATGTGQPFYSEDMGANGTPIRVDGYIVQSAVDCGGVNPQDAATIAHEFGHVLGLPDYYHPTADGGAEGRRWVLGCWELMAAGSWGCGAVGSNREPFGPTHMSARSKNNLGWLDYVTVGEVWDEELVLDPVQESGKALRIPLDTSGREFLLVEYRTLQGFDAQLPAGGVLIYHQDFQGAFRPIPGTSTPYFLRLVEQDDNRGLVRNTFEGGNRGEAGDAWGVDGAVQAFHYGTKPSLRLNAGGAATSVTLHRVTTDGTKARIRISTSPTPRIVGAEALLEVQQVVPFEMRYRVAGGVMPFTNSGSAPAGVTVTAEGDQIVVRGSVSGPGPFHLSLRVTDARGTQSAPVVIPLVAGAWQPDEARLVQPFLGSAAEPLTPGERAYLDALGNGNGRYDVGDLRAWLRRASSSLGG